MARWLRPSLLLHMFGSEHLWGGSQAPPLDFMGTCIRVHIPPTLPVIQYLTNNTKQNKKNPKGEFCL